MNTLNLIKKQIEKASALHDAQIANTTYRGVKLIASKALRKSMAPSAIVVAPTLSDRHGSTSSSNIRFYF